MTSLLCVRAVIFNPADCPEFDKWYGSNHAPQAVIAFAPLRFWRCWSRTDPRVHYIFYEFADLSTIDRVCASADFQRLVGEFSDAWGDRVERSREIMEVVEKYAK